ncbi:hypothetical protein DM01DRAFT_1277935, partial [Hesseltinella vesiculosa]
ELNPIEQAAIKHHVRRDRLEKTEQLSSCTREACKTVPHEHLRNYTQHSINRFEKCL